MLCYKHAGKQMIAQGRGGRIIGAHPVHCGFPFLSSLTVDTPGSNSLMGKQGHIFPLRRGGTNLTLYEQPLTSSRRTAQLSLLSAVSRKRLARPYRVRYFTLVG